MAKKTIAVSLQGKTSEFNFRKLDRSMIYGKRRRLVLDPSGKPCERAALTDDGTTLIRAKMTSQGYFNEDGDQIPRGELVGIDGEGNVVEKSPSTLGDAQELQGPVPAETVLDLQVESVYLLDEVELDPALQKSLDAGDVYRFRFNYYADYTCQAAFLVANDEGIFALIGNPIVPEWCELEQLAGETFEEESLDDELDFEMF